MTLVSDISNLELCIVSRMLLPSVFPIDSIDTNNHIILNHVLVSHLMNIPIVFHLFSHIFSLQLALVIQKSQSIHKICQYFYNIPNVYRLQYDHQD